MPTLTGDILAFSNMSIWNTTAKVEDFQKTQNFGSNMISGRSERIAFEIDLVTGKVVSENRSEFNKKSVLSQGKSTTEWLSLLVHDYESMDKNSKKGLWRVKHSDMISDGDEAIDSFEGVSILTRGKFISGQLMS